MGHLRLVLEVNQLVVNKKKCQIGRQSVDYLGHVISAKGVAMDPSKISSILHWSTPHNVRAVRGFLGLTANYLRFIQGYEKVTQPLTDLLKKSLGFNWTAKEHRTFELKERMITAAVLSRPDFSKPFIIECDASGRGLGAVLIQDNKLVAYFSKALSDRT